MLDKISLAELYSYHTISSFVEAVLRITVAGEDYHLVATVLQADCCIDDEPLSSSDAKIRMEESDVLLPGRVCHGGW